MSRGHADTSIHRLSYYALTAAMSLSFLPSILLALGTFTYRDKKVSTLDLQIVNFNNEFLNVTWNTSSLGPTNLTFLYKLSPGDNYSQCPLYVLRGGLTAGCRIDQPLDDDPKLFLRVSDGAEFEVTRSFYAGDFFKPAPVGPLAFLWGEDTVTVTCENLPMGGIAYEIQHKTIFDAEWQTQEEETCNVTIWGVDRTKCHDFRVRVTLNPSAYGDNAQPSDWSRVAHQENGVQTGGDSPTVIFGLVALLTVSLVALSAWKLRRMKTFLIPSIPDPKVTFLGLFESHQGDFQEWIQDTQNVSCVVSRDGHGVPEEPVVVPWSRDEATTVQEAKPGGLPGGGGGDQRLQLQGFTFWAKDDSYVTL
ncbi:cytokine receptor-like factor 2 [Suncus etruscus]|uniref:cytokine receptor-like factor 2 n=1 Tax=Suncus etruscus TaxID=109475 RepID=UPI00210FB328|nr:cytokine receptor-like factor 2 [Suncus etruscus]